MKKELTALFIILITFNFKVYSQSKDDVIIKGINALYSIKFDSAELQFNYVAANYPNDPTGFFFLAMLEWWKINIDRLDESKDESFLGKIKRTIDVCDGILDKNESDFNGLFFKGGALGYRGLLRGTRDNWLKAAEDGKEALDLLSKARDLQPNNKDVLFGVGLYNYFAEYIPEKFPIIKPLMIIFPKGDKIKGLYQIKETSLNSKYASIEARYIIAYLNVFYEKNYSESEFYSKSLNSQFPDNPVFERFLNLSRVGLGKVSEAYEGWNVILQKAADKKAGYNTLLVRREANYYCGLCLHNQGRTEEAESYFLESESISAKIDKEDSEFGVKTALLLGMVYDLKHNSQKSSYYYNKVMDMKNFGNSRNEAEYYKKYGFRK